MEERMDVQNNVCKEGICCRGIGKHYGSREVLKGVDLTLEKGKIYGLIGRNGAGKTTLLSILSAQNPASYGEVLLDGQPVWENQAALNRICFSRELNPASGLGGTHMKVKEYLKLAGMYLPGWDKAMAEELAVRFGLDTGKKIEKLSKGMLSMVSILVAMASKAEYTFLDEPVAGLDVVAREQFYRLLLEEYETTGRTFVISTHIIGEMENLMEEVLIMKDGSLLLKENTQELLDRCIYISGRKDDVEAASREHTVLCREMLGRGAGAMLLLKPQELPDPGADLTVQSVNLQKLFVAMCGEELT
ncbi:MAG: ABC transporter ATP-binding protein [Lachnospiraceae bacterium]|nr:ABC transporter ATP-binding protein [Lachnospiraceae bacterium]